jgi:hypothetical protein
MNSIHATRPPAAAGFWARLAFAVEAAGESYEERLEKRVSRLEAEVKRLAAIDKTLAKA